jgi:hypothetical protein
MSLEFKNAAVLVDIKQSTGREFFKFRYAQEFEVMPCAVSGIVSIGVVPRL